MRAVSDASDRGGVTGAAERILFDTAVAEAPSGEGATAAEGEQPTAGEETTTPEETADAAKAESTRSCKKKLQYFQSNDVTPFERKCDEGCKTRVPAWKG